MKKLTLLLIAAVMISSGVDAQCCKKGGHCTKACSKDSKGATSKTTTTTKTTVAAKKTS